ncbi:hypothetical protein ABW21_db0203176 [Orbilia brochopaga]|nr:hypothetical protein ABW21_db0203176 [Drechslerella brochopaga]
MVRRNISNIDAYHRWENRCYIDLSPRRFSKDDLKWSHTNYDLPELKIWPGFRPATLGVKRVSVSKYMAKKGVDENNRKIKIHCATEYIPLGNFRRNTVKHSPELTGKDGKVVAALLVRPHAIHRPTKHGYYSKRMSYNSSNITGYRITRSHAATTSTGQPNIYGDSPFAEDWTHPDDVELPKYKIRYDDPACTKPSRYKPKRRRQHPVPPEIRKSPRVYNLHGLQKTQSVHSLHGSQSLRKMLQKSPAQNLRKIQIARSMQKILEPQKAAVKAMRPITRAMMRNRMSQL